MLPWRKIPRRGIEGRNHDTTILMCLTEGKPVIPRAEPKLLIDKHEVRAENP